MKYFEKYGGGHTLTETKYTRLDITVKWVRFYNGSFYNYAVAIFDNRKNKITHEKDYKTFKGARDYYTRLNNELIERV